MFRICIIWKINCYRCFEFLIQHILFKHLIIKNAIFDFIKFCWLINTNQILIFVFQMSVLMIYAHFFMYKHIFNIINYFLRVNEQKNDNVCEINRSINHVYEFQKHLKNIRI